MERVEAMITAEEIEAILSRKFPEAVVSAVDLTGTSDHFEVRMQWSGFGGKSLVQQHQLVHDALKEPLEDGRIHALKIKTLVGS